MSKTKLEKNYLDIRGELEHQLEHVKSRIDQDYPEGNPYREQLLSCYQEIADQVLSREVFLTDTLPLRPIKVIDECKAINAIDTMVGHGLKNVFVYFTNAWLANAELIHNLRADMS